MEGKYNLMIRNDSSSDNLLIDTVIFDIGGVLVKLGRYEFLASKGYTGEIAHRIMHATMKSKDWVHLDLNDIPEEIVLRKFIENDPGIEKEIINVFSDVYGIVQEKERSLPWVKYVKSKGKKVLYMSNYSYKIMHDCPKALYFLPEMDGGLFSCDVHMVKPDLSFYNLLIKKYKLIPQKCVFIDDLEVNLEPAMALGMRTILFQTQEQAETELDNLLKSSKLGAS